MDGRVMLTRNLPNNFFHKWVAARTHDVVKCLKFDVGGVETTPKKLISSCPENGESKHQLQTPKQIPSADVKKKRIALDDLP